MNDATLLAAVLDREVERLSGLTALSEEVKRLGSFDAIVEDRKQQVQKLEEQATALENSVAFKQDEDRALAKKLQEALEFSATKAKEIKADADKYADDKRKEADALLADAEKRSRETLAKAEAEGKKLIDDARTAISRFDDLVKR